MKGKNFVYIARSLDGYIAGKNGEIDWLESIPNPDNSDLGFYKFIEGIDAIVMGRNSFEVVCGFGGEWPYNRPLFVLSNSLKSVPEKYSDKAEVISGTIPELQSALYARGYYNLYIDGGMTIQSFLKEDLIDELIISTIPILLGGGIPLFGALSNSMAFDHIDSEVLLGQIVKDHYRRKRD